MTNTRKFSEMTQAELEKGAQSAGLSSSGENIIMDVNLQFSESGTTAERPGSPAEPTIRYNTDLQKFEFWNGASWSQLEDSADIALLIARLAAHTAGDGASMIGLEDQGSVSNQTVQDLAEADFIVKSDTSALANAIALSGLSSGLLVNTTGTGVLTPRSIDGSANQIVVTNGDGQAANPTASIATNPTLPGNANVVIPFGTTAERPGSPSNGYFRYNTTLDQLEYWDNNALAWVQLGADKEAGGANTQIQYNNNGVLDGDTGFTTDGAGSVNLDGDLTLDDLFFDDNTLEVLNEKRLILRNGPVQRKFVTYEKINFLQPFTARASADSPGELWANSPSGTGLASIGYSSSGDNSGYRLQGHVGGISTTVAAIVLEAFKFDGTDNRDNLTGSETLLTITNGNYYPGATDTPGIKLFNFLANGNIEIDKGSGSVATIGFVGTTPTLSASGSTDDIDLDLQFQGNGAYNFRGTSTRGARTRYYERTTEGTNFITLQTPASLPEFYAIILPKDRHADGGNVMVGDFNGSVNTMSWEPWEEGAWTPVLIGSTTAGSPTGSFLGAYSRHGDRVFLTGQINLTSLGGLSGNLKFSGLPYPVANGSANRTAITVGFMSTFDIPVVIGGWAEQLTTTVQLYNMEVNATRLTQANIGDGGNFIFALTYATDS